MDRAKIKRGNGPRHVFFFLLTILVFVLTFVFLDQAQIVKNAPGYYIQPFSLVMALMVGVTIIGLITAIAIHLTPRFYLSTITILIINGLFLFFVGIVANVLTLPETMQISVEMLDKTFETLTLTHTSYEKFLAISVAAVNFAFIVFVILFLPNQKHFNVYVKLYAALIIFGGVAALGYSFVTEFNLYIDIAKHGFGSKVPQSFVGNRNPFASLMLTSELLLLLMYYLNHNKKRRFIYILLTLPFIVAIHFTFSKTNTLLAYLLVILLFYRHLYTLIKRSIPRFIVELILSTGLIVFFFIYRFSPAVETTLVSRVLQNLFPSRIFEVGERTLIARINLWKNAFSLVNAHPRFMYIGSGVYLSRKFYFTRLTFQTLGYGVEGYADYHNGFVEATHTFGYVGLAVYVIVLALVLYVLAKRLKTDRSLAFYSLISLIVFVLRSQTESLVMLSIKTEGVIASLAFVLPFLVLTNKSHLDGHSPNLLQKKS